METTRSRIVKRSDYVNTYQISLGPPFGGDPATEAWSVLERQKTTSEGHPVSRLRKTGEDIGGNFLTQRTHISSAVNVGRLIYDATAPQHRWMRGSLLAAAPPKIFLPGEVQESDWQAVAQLPHVDFLHERGATAIASTIPTNPTVSVAASIGELREGLPAIPGRSVLKGGLDPRRYADEYLNLEFGIKPIIADVRNFTEARRNADKRLAQLYRDSGRLVRRRRSFPRTVTTSTQKVTGSPIFPWGPGTSAWVIQSPASLETTTTITQDVWFAGGYTYFFPKQEGWHQKMLELEKIYGIIPDITDVYQLTPWSWAVDWVSNFGSLVQNLHAFSQDNLVLRFGYVMCRTHVETVNTWSGRVMADGISTPTTITTRWGCTSKQRLKATPYGFGLNPDTFTTRQKAIIAALGISRAGSR